MRRVCSLLCSLLLLAITPTMLIGCGGGSNRTGDSGSSTASMQKTGSSAASSKGVDYSGRSQVNVMSYNVYYKDVASRADNIIDLIKKGSADVIGLQEVSVDWHDPLYNAFVKTGKYGYYGYGRYGGEWSGKQLQSGEEFSLILYSTEKFTLLKSGHFWCSSTPDIYSSRWKDGVNSDFPRCINWVRLKDKQTSKEFLFVCNHLDPQSEIVRVNSAELITQKMNQIAAGSLCILVGDWNSGLSNSSYKKITSGGFSDVRFIAEKTTQLGTFQDWGKRKQDSWAIGDIIFTSNNLAKIKKFDVMTDQYDGEFVSDHCPVVASIFY